MIGLLGSEHLLGHLALLVAHLPALLTTETGSIGFVRRCLCSIGGSLRIVVGVGALQDIFGSNVNVVAGERRRGGRFGVRNQSTSRHGAGTLKGVGVGRGGRSHVLRIRGEVEMLSQLIVIRGTLPLGVGYVSALRWTGCAVVGEVLMS